MFLLELSVGSAMYFPSISNYEAGGWLFTIGSLAFAIADFTEWLTNNHVGCICYERFEADYESQVGPLFDPPNTSSGRNQRAANGFNFFCSFCGSFIYLVGSALFIPSIGQYVAGGYLFIVASIIIVLAQSWKLCRSGYDFSSRDTLQLGFNFANWHHDIPGILVDACAGIGAFGYIVGSVLFMPEYNIDTDATYRAAAWFQFGGTFFALSGLCMFYRYFFTLNYPH
jgi:hypothetical protein